MVVGGRFAAKPIDPLGNTPGPHGKNDAGDPDNRTVFGMPRGLMAVYRFADRLDKAGDILSSTRSAVLHLVGSVDQGDLDAAKRIINHVKNNPEASLKNLRVLAEAALTTAQESIDICEVQDLMRKLGLPCDLVGVAADILIESANPRHRATEFFPTKLPEQIHDGSLQNSRFITTAGLGVINQFWMSIPMAAGCVVGTLQALWDTLESSVDMIVDTDKLVDEIIGLFEILLSPGGEEACREIGRQSGAQIAADFKRIAGADRIVAAYEIGKIIGPTVTGIIVTILTAGGVGAVVASGRMAQIIARIRRIRGGKLIIDRISKRGKGSKAVKKTLDATNVATPGEKLAPRKATTGDAAMDQEIDAAFDKLEAGKGAGTSTGKFDPARDPHAGPGVRIPVDKEGKPAEVLDVGAGSTPTDLGLAPEKDLVAIERSDYQKTGAHINHVFDARKTPPPHLLGKMDALLINNPRGFIPNIEELGKALKLNGRIIVQGRARIGPASTKNVRGFNPDFQALVDRPAPPGTRKLLRSIKVVCLLYPRIPLPTFWGGPSIKRKEISASGQTPGSSSSEWRRETRRRGDCRSGSR